MFAQAVAYKLQLVSAHSMFAIASCSLHDRFPVNMMLQQYEEHKHSPTHTEALCA